METPAERLAASIVSALAEEQGRPNSFASHCHIVQQKLDGAGAVVPEEHSQVWIAPATGDDEVSALSGCVTMLERLDPAASARAARYLSARYKGAADGVG